MKLPIVRLARKCSRLSVAWLPVVWSSTVLAQSTVPPVPSPNPEAVATTPAPAVAAAPAPAQVPSPAPAVAARRTMTVEERLQKLETMNQQLLQQNQQLNRELKTVSRKVDAPEVAVVQPPAGGANVPATRPLTGAAAGGGPLMATPSGGMPPDLYGLGGIGANVPRAEPSVAGAFGGEDLISFDARDTRGIEATGRFGRRFVNNSLWFFSPNKYFQFHVGGRVQLDTVWLYGGNTVQFGPRGVGKLRDGVDPRRLRPRFEGAMYENMLYVVEIDFANTAIVNPQGTGISGPTGPLTGTFNTPVVSIPAPADVWVGFRKIPYIGNVRIGIQKEPFGFERLCSSRFLNFMERAYINDAFQSTFTNGFIPGVQAFNTAFDLHMTWAAGIFSNVTNPWDYHVGGGDWAETARVTGLLLYENEGRQVMHLGITGRNSGYDNGTSRFRVRGDERSGVSTDWANYADTGAFHARGGQQDINLESVNVFGQWTVDAEYNFHFNQNSFLGGANGLRQTNVGTLFYSGGYVEVLYFLTGEHRAYIRESGLYDRIVPRKDAYWVKGEKGKPNEFGWGAWQVGLRYNYLNLNDKGINGGVLDGITVGLNWFLNPNAKLQWNYSVTVRHSPASPGQPIGLSDGTIQGFGMRLAMDY